MNQPPDAVANGACGPSTEFDAVQLEVLWSRLISIVDEAAKAIVRTSFSTLSNEANDFACVLTDARGRSIAQNTGSIPSFIATLPATVRHFLDEFDAEDIGPGDVFITNDPWKGTGHLSDVCIVKPIFDGSSLVAFAATTSHVPDIGGRLRAIESRQIFEEGLQIPPMKLVAAGRVDETLVRLIRQNVRTPEQTLGDIWAQVGANELMQRRVLELMRDYGLSTLDGFTGQILARAEQAMRAAIAQVPDGEWHYVMHTDGGESPYRFEVRLSVRGDELVADFTGSSPVQPRAINCVYAYTYAMTAYAVKCALLPELANNDGMFRPIKVIAPEGSLLNPAYPAAVVARANTGHYVPVCVFGALAQVVPERVMAGAGSPLWVFTVTGLDESGRSFANVLFFNGGMGAAHGADGESCLSWPSNISSTPVEIAERNGPLLCLYKRLQPGSGGDGQWRGGLGQEMLFECTAERSVTALFMAERTRFAAPGLLGGGDGETGTIEINGEVIDHRRQHVLHKGDRVLIRTPGGGGYGSPVRRDPGAQRLDRALGLIEETTNDA